MELAALWFLRGIIVLGMVGTVLTINQPRKPVTPGLALAVLICNFLMLASLEVLA